MKCTAGPNSSSSAAVSSAIELHSRWPGPPRSSGPCRQLITARPCSPSGPDSSTLSPGSMRSKPSRAAGCTRPRPVVVSDQPVAGGPLHDLGVAGDDLDARRLGRPAGGVQHPPQQGDLQALLDHQRQADRQRLGARHGQVVDRPADGQLADVPTGELQRLDDVAVGREGQPCRPQPGARPRRSGGAGPAHRPGPAGSPRAAAQRSTARPRRGPTGCARGPPSGYPPSLPLPCRRAARRSYLYAAAQAPSETDHARADRVARRAPAGKQRAVRRQQPPADHVAAPTAGQLVAFYLRQVESPRPRRTPRTSSRSSRPLAGMTPSARQRASATVNTSSISRWAAALPPAETGGYTLVAAGLALRPAAPGSPPGPPGSGPARTPPPRTAGRTRGRSARRPHSPGSR